MAAPSRYLFRNRTFVNLLLLVGLVLVVGTVFYNHYEHWGVINSLYFSVTTLTTVGFGDFTPSTTVTKLFTIIYLLFGISIILGFVDVVAKHATRRYIKRAEDYMERSESYLKQNIEKLSGRTPKED